MRRKPPAPRQPGVAADTQHDPDAAIAAGKQGKAHKVSKHPDPATLPASKVAGDPERPREAPVNAKREMTYEKAMQALDARNELDRLRKVASPSAEQAARIEELEKVALKRSVLTEQGWVVVAKDAPQGTKA